VVDASVDDAPWKEKRLPNGDESPVLLFEALDAISKGSSEDASVAISVGARSPNLRAIVDG
jgi:hypothetical protein